MKNKNVYTFQIGKEKRKFSSNTSGIAYEKALTWKKENRPSLKEKPILFSKNGKLIQVL